LKATPISFHLLLPSSLRVSFTSRVNQGLLSQMSIKIRLNWSVELSERGGATLRQFDTP